jgi:hypothetical protein
MKKYIIFILLFLPSIIFSQTFIKEYTYYASEKDSKIDARNNALSELKKLVIEEVGTLVSTDTKLNKTDEIVIESKTRVISESITKTKILEETWDGYKYYIKAEIFVDEKDLSKRLERIKLEYYNNLNKNLNNNKPNYPNSTLNYPNSTSNYPTIYDNEDSDLDYIGLELKTDYQPNLKFFSASISGSFIYKGFFELGAYGRKELGDMKNSKYFDSGILFGLLLLKNDLMFRLPIKIGKAQIYIDGDKNSELFVLNPSLEIGYKIKKDINMYLLLGVGYKYVTDYNTESFKGNIDGLNISLGLNVLIN